MRLRLLAPITLTAVLVLASWSVAVTGSAQSAEFTVSIDKTRYMGNNEACIEFSTNPAQPGATYTATVAPFGTSRTGTLNAAGRGASQHTVVPTENTATVSVTSGGTTRQASKTFTPGPAEGDAICEPSQGTASPSPSPTRTSSASPSPTSTQSASPSPTSSGSASPSPSQSASPSPSATSSASPSPSPSQSPSPEPVDDPRCGQPRVICGTSGDDKLIGTSGDDIIIGGAGDDIIKGRGGDDHLEGGSGSDTITGGGGNDLLKGGSGPDNLKGNAGRDRLNGGPGNDACDGGPGKDRQRSC